MRRLSDSYDSSRWTGNTEPLAAEALLLILAVGAICFLVIGFATL